MQRINIELCLDTVEHLKDFSCYNHNFYRVSNYGDSCLFYDDDIIEEVCHEDENYYTIALGHFDVNKEFIPVLKWSSDVSSFCLNNRQGVLK